VTDQPSKIPSLVERLRADTYTVKQVCSYTVETRPLSAEAADQIERLTVELAEEREMHADVDAALKEEVDETERHQWQPIESAPKDGTLVLLIVNNGEMPTGGISAKPLEDEEFSRTVGFNNRDNTGDDVWDLAGWCWEHDHFTQASRGVVPTHWMPFPPSPAEPGDKA
jgi:hypothetical protein